MVIIIEFKSQIYLFWYIGKCVYEKQKIYENAIKKYSEYCSYLFGNSFLFTRENVYLMKRFYLNFPVYYSKLDNISWDQYKLLLMIPNKKERMFYFNLSILFKSDLYDTNSFIMNNYYHRI